MALNNIYIQIPIEEQDDFAVDYETVTGEIWVKNNIKDDKGTMPMMGSTKCTEAMAVELEKRWPLMKYNIIEHSAGLPTDFTQNIEAI